MEQVQHSLLPWSVDAQYGSVPDVFDANGTLVMDVCGDEPMKASSGKWFHKWPHSEAFCLASGAWDLIAQGGEENQGEPG